MIDPVRSRCLCIRVAAPSSEETIQVLQHVADAENLILPPVLASRITAASERSLRRALLMMEVCRVAQYPFTDDQQLQAADWELYIQVHTPYHTRASHPSSTRNLMLLSFSVTFGLVTIPGVKESI